MLEMEESLSEDLALATRTQWSKASNDLLGYILEEG